MKTRFVVSLSIAALLVVSAFNSSAQDQTYSAVVTGVTSGDIYKIDRKGKEQLVVLYGVQTGPNKIIAQQAREFAEKRVLNQHVTVRVVGKKPGLTLVEFTLANNINLSHVMLRNGLLRWDSFTAPSDQGLKDLEALAKQEKLGMWSGGVPSAPASAAGQKNANTGTDEKQYERRFRAGYDILEGRSYKDEKGVPTLILKGNGEKQEGYEGEVAAQAADENAAIQAEQERIAAEEAAAAQAAYEEQLRAEQEAAQQAQMQNVQMLNQQLLLGGYFRPGGLRVTPALPY